MPESIAIELITSAGEWETFLQELKADSSTAEQLQREAAGAAADPLLTVIAKRQPAPSGDPHDYLSTAPYWWPDPGRPDGLPWIRRDGEINPVYYDYDNITLARMCRRVELLILDAAVNHTPGAAEQAAEQLKTWFLDPETRMNPHLRYAQFIPGRCDGRGIGIIDTVQLIGLVDCISRLPFNSGWTPADLEKLREWFSVYLKWLKNSENGKDEEREHNNHGTWYDAQVVLFALFTRQPEIARAQIEHHTLQRLDTQLAADGSLPFELERTLSKRYVVYNLSAFAILATLGRHFGLDLWNRRGPAGQTPAQALEWLDARLFSANWPGRQIAPFQPERAAHLYHLGARLSGRREWERRSRELAVPPWLRLVRMPDS